MTTLTERATGAPERSYDQRMEALERANEVRTFRAQIKRDVKAGEFPIAALLELGDEDERLATMKVLDALLAAPRVGRVKANKILSCARVSPSKTLAGMTERQRQELIRALSIFPSTRRLRDWACDR